MNETTIRTSFRRAVRFVAVAGVALTLAIGSGQAANAQDAGEEECQADRSNHLLNGLLTDELTFVSKLLPFTLAGEQYPVCE